MLIEVTVRHSVDSTNSESRPSSTSSGWCMPGRFACVSSMFHVYNVKCQVELNDAEVYQEI